jgi:hypothetical protein
MCDNKSGTKGAKRGPFSQAQLKPRAEFNFTWLSCHRHSLAFAHHEEKLIIFSSQTQTGTGKPSRLLLPDVYEKCCENFVRIE